MLIPALTPLRPVAPPPEPTATLSEAALTPPARRSVVYRPRQLAGDVELWSGRGVERPWTFFSWAYAFCHVRPGNRSGFWRHRKVRHAVTSSGVVVIEPGELLLSEGLAAPVDYDMVLVTPARLERILGGDPSLDRRRHFRPAVIDDPVLAASLGRLAQALAEPLLHPARVEELLTSFLGRTFRRACTPDPALESASIDRAVARAREAVSKRFSEKLRLDEIAAIGGVSKFHLERAFHARIGVPVYQYLKRVRVAGALEQIRQGGRPLDVSRRVGFADQPHMTRVFQQELGLTPRQYGLGRGPLEVGTPGPRARLHDDSVSELPRLRAWASSR